MAFEYGRCELLFSYWLAEKTVMKKSAKMLGQPHLNLWESPPSSSLNKINAIPKLLQFG
jgi:hypothetical protein